MFDHLRRRRIVCFPFNEKNLKNETIHVPADCFHDSTEIYHKTAIYMEKNVCSKILYKTFSLQMFDEHGNAFML